MFKNRIMVKLSLYFIITLLAFSVIISCIFIILLKNHTVDFHKNQLLERAEAIASTFSDDMEKGCGCRMIGCNKSYFKFAGDIYGTDVWMVDKYLNLSTNIIHRRSKNVSDDYKYSDLPENAGKLIEEVFLGETVFSEDFSGILAEPTLTIGVPIENNIGCITGVILLHSPVNGINEAILKGTGLLAISLGIALAATFLLSIWLSKAFTEPIASKEAQDALRLEKIRSEFVANISHELKTPITVIRGSLEALVEKIVTEPVQVEEYHNQMLHEAAFLQRLVGDLLDLSKLQNTDFVMEKQDISICDILDDVIRSISQVPNKKGVKINIEKDSASCIGYGDYGRIRQMIMIILDNAIKFSHENGVVDIKFKNRTMVIRDYGCGISEKELPFVFDRFYKSRSEQNKTGTGLGLAIAKQIAERHGIKISVKSDEGKGSEFSIEIP